MKTTLKQSLGFAARSLLVPCLILFLQAGCATRPASPATPSALQSLQGAWEGVMQGHEKDGKITVTFTGNSLHFYRDTNFWFDTTFTLPPGTDPAQLHATIQHSAPPENGIGTVVRAIFKIGEGNLTLISKGGGEDLPKNFEPTDAGAMRYEFRKVQPQGKNAGPSKSN